MFVWSADANVSAGAPCWICVASVDDDPKLNVADASGFAVWKSFPICVKAPVSEAAADTVILPDTLDALVVDVVELPDFESLPQAATAIRQKVTTTRSTVL